jgi:hypothetical protein
MSSFNGRKGEKEYDIQNPSSQNDPEKKAARPQGQPQGRSKKNVAKSFRYLWPASRGQQSVISHLSLGCRKSGGQQAKPPLCM